MRQILNHLSGAPIQSNKKGVVLQILGNVSPDAEKSEIQVPGLSPMAFPLLL